MKLGFVYVMLVFPSFRIKVGKTTNLLKRRKDIQDSINEEKRGKFFPQLVLPIWFVLAADYAKIEKACHRSFEFGNYTWIGSGKTEYFISVLAPFIIMYLTVVQIKLILILILKLSAIGFIFWALSQIV